MPQPSGIQRTSQFPKTLKYLHSAFKGPLEYLCSAFNPIFKGGGGDMAPPICKLLWLQTFFYKTLQTFLLFLNMYVEGIFIIFWSIQGSGGAPGAP